MVVVVSIVVAVVIVSIVVVVVNLSCSYEFKLESIESFVWI